MKIELVSVKKSERKVIDSLFQFYLYDMSEYMGWNVNSDGQFDVNLSILDNYWDRDDHFPFFIFCDVDLAGFSLLRHYPNDITYLDIGQFFILRKFKRKGIGREAFKLSVSKFPGKWLTRVLPENEGAVKFWLNVISDITKENYCMTSEFYGENVLMHFIRYEIISS